MVFQMPYFWAMSLGKYFTFTWVYKHLNNVQVAWTLRWEISNIQAHLCKMPNNLELASKDKHLEQAG